MTPAQITAARAALGERWGFPRPLKRSELGRALGFDGRDPGRPVSEYESGKYEITGSTAQLLRVYLAGALPPGGVETIKP
tara:strand:+ start:336 stop:575 length:240 start_codon:yes stop_codon:yes gene_type:complete